MPRQSASDVPGVSFCENAPGFKFRDGQIELLKWMEHRRQKNSMAFHWPTGYGKTIGLATVFKFLIERGEVDRLLFVSANDAQREQFFRDFQADCAVIGLVIPPVWRFSREAVTARMSLEGKAIAFVANIQTVSSTNKSPIDTLLQLTRAGGKWLLATDEGHHLADGRDWGDAIKRLIDEAVFWMAMSATPYRGDRPTVFKSVDLRVRYQDAVAEGAVKRMLRHSYNYLVETIDEENHVETYETKDLIEIAARGEMDTWEERKRLRYTAKYIWPLITNPVARLLETRLQWRFHIGDALTPQMLVRAWSCRHARVLVDQIRTLVDDTVTVDWVGTGVNGRPDDENKAILTKFCPQKRKDGVRPRPELDVLVQVAMAGEGLDTVPVSEIVDLSLTRCLPPANQDKQMYGRGARWVPGLPRELQVCHINIPTDHPLAAWQQSIDAWFDDETPPPKAPGDNNGNGENGDWEPSGLPHEPPEIRRVELLDIRSDPHFTQWLKAMDRAAEHEGRKAWNPDDPSDMLVAEEMFKKVFQSKAAEQDERLNLENLRSAIDEAVGKLAYMALRARQKRGGTGRIEKSAIKDAKRLINTRLLRVFGERSSLTPDELKQIWTWLADLDDDLRGGRPPLWLM